MIAPRTADSLRAWPGGRAFRSIAADPDGEIYPGVLVLGFDAGLSLLDADALEDRIPGQDMVGSPLQ